MSDVVTYFAYTGADQSVTIPTGATNAYVQCWGAGGATTGVGALTRITGSSGGGGYTDAFFSVSSYVGTSLKVIVGGGGKFGNSGVVSNATYGGGGSSGPSDPNWGSCSGGGRSAVRLYVSSTYIEIITAGGGGGGGQTHKVAGYTPPDSNGGAGGGLVGGNADQPEGGFGGTQTVGGAVGTNTVGDNVGISGSQYTGGGGAHFSAGGGGGWFGGGAGGSSGCFGGGGGGSSHIDSIYTQSGAATTVTQGTLPAVANNSGLPSDVIGTIGNGALYSAGSVNGKNGYVIITFYTSNIHANVQPTEPIIITEPISSRFMQLLMME
jgi:hypothetical protein